MNADREPALAALLLDVGRLDMQLDQSISARMGQLSKASLSELLVLANQHRLLSAVTRILASADGAPRPVRNMARRIQRVLRQDHAIRTAHVNDVLAALDERSVDSVVMKGPVLADQCYPHRHLREFNDLDLLVHPEDLETVARALGEVGYTQSEVDLETGTAFPLSAARLDGYARELQHLGEFVRQFPDGSFLSIDVHFRLSTIFDSVAPDTRQLLATAVRKPGYRYKQLGDAAFVTHLCYHAWWDTQSIANVANGKDLRLAQFADIRLALIAWGLECAEVLRFAREAGVAEVVHWALSVTQDLFGDLAGSAVIDVSVAQSIDLPIVDRWVSRGSGESIGTWQEPASSRMFDPDRANYARDALASWIEGHLHNGDVLEWRSREPV